MRNTWKINISKNSKNIKRHIKNLKTKFLWTNFVLEYSYLQKASRVFSAETRLALYRRHRGSFRDEGFSRFFLGRWIGYDVFAVVFLVSYGYLRFCGRGSIVRISCIFQCIFRSYALWFYIATIGGDMVASRRTASLERVIFSRWGEALYSRDGNFVKSFILKLASKFVDWYTIELEIFRKK